MNKEPKEGRSKTYISYGLLTLIFFIDCFFSLGFFGGIPYVIGLVLVMWLLPPQEMMRFGFVCGVVALLGFFSPPAEIQDNMGGLMTRFMAIFTVIAIAILARREADVADKHEEEKNLLNSVIDKRTDGLKQVVDQFDEVKIRLSEAEQLGPFGFWEFYPRNQQMIWSNGMFNIYGYPISPQAPSYQEFLNLTHVDDIRLFQETIESTISEKKPTAVEYRIIMPDGAFKWLYFKGRPVINTEGQVDNIVGTIQDVTLLKQSAHQTDVNTAKYTTLFKSASIPKALFIPDKKIIEVNKAFCRWTGYHEKELLKIPIEKLMHKDDRSMEDAYAKDIIQGELEVYRQEKRFVRKNGQTVWGFFSVAAVLDAANRVLYFSAEIVDTTRLKAAETARKKAEEAWHEAEHTLNELEAEKRIAAQQGTSPITPTMSDPELEEELEKAYGMAEEVIDHLFEVSHDMLAIVGEDGLYKRISPSMGQFLGFHPEQLDDQPVINLIHPDQKEDYKAYQARLFSGHPAPRMVVYHQKSNGEYVSLSLSAAFNPDHQVAYFNLKHSESDEVIPQPLLQSAESISPEITELPPVQEEQTIQQLPIEPPSFVETEEPVRAEPEPIHAGLEEERDSYPSIEDHLAQLYGEVDPAKVFLEDKPAAQSKSFEEPPPLVPQNTIQPLIEEEPDSQYAEEELPDEPQSESTFIIPEREEEDQYPPIEEYAIQEQAPENSLQESHAFITPPSDELADSNQDYLQFESPEEDLDEPAKEINTVPSSGVIPSIYQAQPPVDQLSEPLDHLYYDDDEPELPPISPIKPAPKREFSDIHWRQLTDKMPFFVWMLDQQRNCKYVNKKLRSFTGLPFEQLEGKGWSKTVHPEDYRKYVKYAAGIVKEYKPVGFAYRTRRADGIYRWMQETSIPLFDKTDRFEGYLATSLDISKLKKVGAYFAKALDSAINLEDIHSSLVPCLEDESTLAITDSIKVADALISNALDMPQRELSTLMNLAGQRMLSLVNGMLAFSSIQPKKTDLILREIDVRSVMTDTIDMITPLRRTEGPRFQIDTQSDALHILADKVLLHRSLENLIRGLQEAAESRVITVDFAKQHDYGIISIAHLGPILTDNFLVELSDLYRENKRLSLYQRKFGLHLSLIRKLCELMGGALHLYHQEGIGPIISIQLKLAPPHGKNTPAPSQSLKRKPEVERTESLNGEHHTNNHRPAVSRRNAQEKRPRIPQQEFNGSRQQLASVAEAINTLAHPSQESIKANGNGHAEPEQNAKQKILVGEHNKDTQRLIRSLLQPYYDLSIVPDINAFLKQANESSFDLFLLDIHMRSDDGHHGVDILRQIRRMPQYKRTPVIAVASGNSGADKTELIDRAGFDDFLRKPYSIVELLDTVEKVIEA